MLKRLTASLILVCYSVIALFGQGLHAWLHDHGNEHRESHSLALMLPIGSVELETNRTCAGTTGHITLDSADDDCSEHDADHCAICQHHSLGQIFVATLPTRIVLARCALLSTPAPDLIVCPTLFSVALPRAPPVA
jgi:hypothetical protein